VFSLHYNALSIPESFIKHRKWYTFNLCKASTND